MGEDLGNKAPETKDKWDKLKVILEPVGGLLTGVAVVFLTFFTSSRLGKWQEKENNARVYTELMGKREEAETGLRKAMFDSIMGAFLRSSEDASVSLEADVLKMELLAYNFHESLNLTPLFKNLEREIERKLKANPEDAVVVDCRRRLRKVANDIVEKQLAALKNPDGNNWATVLRGNFKEPFSGGSVSEPFPLTVGDFNQELTVGITDRDPDTQELLVSATVRTSNSRPGAKADRLLETHAEFWIGSFEFPMIDNTRLPNDQRCALVLRVFDKDTATGAVPYEVYGVCFPSSRAALQERPYYDEILDHLRQPAPDQ